MKKPTAAGSHCATTWEKPVQNQIHKEESDGESHYLVHPVIPDAH
jgi:hypothetical protein